MSSGNGRIHLLGDDLSQRQLEKKYKQNATIAEVVEILKDGINAALEVNMGPTSFLQAALSTLQARLDDINNRLMQMEPPPAHEPVAEEPPAL